jgi:SOS response regulatory protein OraA/RecX
MGAPVVTALRARGHGRVAVELDGAPWRVVPLEAVYAAELAVGSSLDRTTARLLGRELRRLRAQATALRALRARDHTAASLERRLATRGTRATVRRDTVEAAQRAGLVDDRRFAIQRAEQLASRGSGDLLIGDDLERHGVPPELVRVAIAALEPEAARADTIVAARGTSPKTARYLASRGFSEAALETIVADLASDALG